MPNLIAQKIRAMTPDLVRRQIIRVGRYFEYPTFKGLEAPLHYLKQRGFEPSLTIDVGAYQGEWTKAFRGLFPKTRVLMIEAQKEKAEMLDQICAESSGEIKFEIALLGPSDGQLVRFVKMGTGSSVLEEASPYERTYVEQRQLTLDSVIGRHPDFLKTKFLKLDVQGYELEVLKGASRALENAEIVLTEASLIPVNRGCPLIAEVIGFMVKRDFRVMDIFSESRMNDGALWQTDIMFIKNNSPYLPSGRLDASNWS